MVVVIIIAAVLVAFATLTVWTHESRRQENRRDKIRQTVEKHVLSAITRLSTGGEEEITSISVLGCLRDMGVKIDVTAVLVALDAQVSEGRLERFTTDESRWFYWSTVTYRLVFPPLFPVAADQEVEERVVYEAVARLNMQGFQASATAVGDLTGLGDRRTRVLLTKLTNNDWLVEDRVPSVTSKDVVFVYQCRPHEGTTGL